MPQAVAHLSQFADGPVQLIRFCSKHLPVDTRPPVWSEHLRDLIEREACGTSQGNQREALQHTGIEQTVQPSPSDRGDQALLLMEA